MSEQATDGYKLRAEQLEVQLAGCLTAAEGWAGEPLKRSEYGWSPAYQATLDLRRKYEDDRTLLEAYRRANEKFAKDLGAAQQKYDLLVELFNRLAKLNEQSTAARPHEQRAIETEFRELNPPPPTRRTEP